MKSINKDRKKIVIIGGGVAGLAFSILMKKKGYEIVINEKCHEIPMGSNAFMMHDEGVEILQNLLEKGTRIPGKNIDTFYLKRPDETEVKYTKMESWRCMKRKDLIDVLLKEIDPKCIRYHRMFSHFIHENGQAVAAVFQDGSVETGDIFIGADGCNSQVRQLLFGETQFSKTEVQEILGVVYDPELIASMQGVFTKYQDEHKGISFGCIPLSDTEAIWFSQFDVALFPITEAEKSDLKTFTKKILNGFPDHVLHIVEATDFSGTYLWQTKDFDPLHSFHKQNIILIGDSAHLALPFTSAGTTNALYDAQYLASLIESETSLEAACTAFYQTRIGAVTEHLNLGRKLKNMFLHPRQIDEKEIEIPLIKYAVKEKNKSNQEKLQVIYFTDPICSTCWTIQPQLRKMKMKYGDLLDIQYVMGGLLPSWDNFNRGGITKPEDVYHHWTEVSLLSGMPIDGTVWLNDPLHSSFPPSIAFKAAQLQDFDKAVIFLRKMNELVFLENHNITKQQIIRRAAFEAGLDAAILLKDMQRKAPELFINDLNLTKSMNIEILPTFVFKKSNTISESLLGAHDYETFEKMVKKHLPSQKENQLVFSPIDLFIEYPSLTKKEFIFLTGAQEQEAEYYLEEMTAQKKVTQVMTKSGPVYYLVMKENRRAA